MDFDLASDSSPAIHSKTTAKVINRIGICKKLSDFLANPNKMGYKTSYNQSFCPYRACCSFAVPALLNRTFQLIFSFS